MNLAGGTHHAFATHGEGFCVLNDVVIALRALRGEGRVGRVAVVDLDVHQGNGTHALCADDPDTYTFSMHGGRNYPFRKERSSLDLGLGDGVTDQEYLRVLRELQDETGGFVAFACWSYQPGGCSARGDDHLGITAADYLMMNAVARLYLDNITHMQSSWVTQGLRIGQLALEAGCDDMGSIMIEENVVRAAGTAFTLDTPRMVEAIEATGRRAVQRDTRYRVVRRF